MSMGTSLRSYYRGHSLVSMRDGQANASRYYHFDAQGTTQCLTNEAGVVTDRFAADAWGVEVKRTGSSINRHWYIGGPGYYTDAGKNAYVRARHFSPQRAAWLSRDPLGVNENFQGMFAYVLNAPAILIDASGLIGNCPPRCSGPARGRQDPDLGPGDKAPCPSQEDYKTIREYCQISRDYFNSGKDPSLGDPELRGHGNAATTSCCGDSWGCGYDIVGCTDYLDDFNTWPEITQKCLIEHEQRRRNCCQVNQNPRLSSPKDDQFQQLQCVWDELKRCLGWSEAQLEQIFKPCKPPSGYKPTTNGCNRI